MNWCVQFLNEPELSEYLLGDLRYLYTLSYANSVLGEWYNDE